MCSGTGRCWCGQDNVISEEGCSRMSRRKYLNKHRRSVCLSSAEAYGLLAKHLMDLLDLEDYRNHDQS